MTNGKPFPQDEICNPNWETMLKMFHNINPESKDAKERFTQVKILSQSKVMTERQHEGIIDRCNNQINGTYGSTSREVKSFKKQ